MISSVIFTISGDGTTPSSEIPENTSPTALAQQLTEPTDTILTLTEEDFREVATRRGVNLSKYSKSHSVVFSSHRGSQIKANRRLEAAKSIHPHAAVEGTFWGMFQIGGFNWKKCGAESIDDFVDRMSRSERDQLEMFAEFITTTGLLKPCEETPQPAA